MLRALVLLLVLANAMFWAWSHEWLAPYGWAPDVQREPIRLSQQVRPDAIKLLSTEDLAKAEALAQADQAPKECWQGQAAGEAAVTAARAWIETHWAGTPAEWEAVELPERWMVYMGKYPNAEALAKKRKELDDWGIKSVEVQKADMEPGLSLGVFESREGAQKALTQLASKGVRTAKVVQEREASTQQWLRLPALSGGQKLQWNGLLEALGTKAFKPCR